jgi:hypothetical protein
MYRGMSQSEVMMTLIGEVGMTMPVSECVLLSSKKADLADAARYLATRLVAAGRAR